MNSGKEPNLFGSESDMYTVQARSKICPCVPPCTQKFGLMTHFFLKDFFHLFS